MDQTLFSKRNRYSVIIPAWNEESTVAECVGAVAGLCPGTEIIVADGNSTDRTVELAGQAGARVVSGHPGRGIQCNRGARLAQGEILMFLHADTRMPENAFSLLDKFFADPEVRIGTFRLRFDMDHWFLRVSGYWTRYDSLLTRFGDQGIVVRRGFFESLGGFPEWPLFEDVELLRRARRQTRIYSFPAEVVTSARKFRLNGPVRQQWRNGILIAKFLCGVSPQQLAKEYRR